MQSFIFLTIHQFPGPAFERSRPADTADRDPCVDKIASAGPYGRRERS